MLGHSFGTFTALRYAIRYPRRTQSLTLLGTVPPRSLDNHFDDNVAARTSAQTKRRLAELATQGRAAPLARRDALADEVGTLLLSAYFYDPANAKPQVAAGTSLRSNAKTDVLLRRDFARYDLRRGLRALWLPVLIVQGRQDPLDLEMAGRTRNAIPGAKMVVLERCGHFAWLEAPQRLRQAVLGFLRGR